MRVAVLLLVLVSAMLLVAANAWAAPAAVVSSETTTAGVGETVEVVVRLNDFTDLFTAQARLRYDPTVLEAVTPGGAPASKAESGDIFTGSVFVAQNRVDTSRGLMDYAVTFLGSNTSKTGSGALFKLQFRVLKYQRTGLLLEEVKIVYLQEEERKNKDLIATSTGVWLNPDAKDVPAPVQPQPPATSPGGSKPVESAPVVPSSGGQTTAPPVTAPTPAPTVPTGAIDYRDLNGHWAESVITELARQGLVSGYPDGTFGPNRQITRAEFVALLDRLLSLPEAAQTAAAPFVDVPAGHWAGDVLARAADAGLVAGDRGLFRPNDPITRAEVAAILTRALNLPPGGELRFTDAVDVPVWAQSSMAAAVEAGLVAGLGDGSLRPLRAATRAEACAMLSRALPLISR